MITVCLIAVLLTQTVSAEAASPPDLSAACAVLIDGESGRVLFEKNAHQERDIASITKLMTALVAAESGIALDVKITIKPEWTGIEGSSIYLKAGEVVSFETLLYGLLLQSGNDAAIAVAAHCAGDVETFVEKMNRKAAQLGMKQTRFANPNGLSEDGHYSTAYDMVLLGQACLNHPVVAEIMATKSITLGSRTFTNHNKLLWRCEGCTGMKTGYTEKAGRTLVSSAQRDGQTLIAVTLNAGNDWSDHEALLDYGFSTFARRLLCREGKVLGRIPVQGGLVSFVSAVTADTLWYPLKESEQVTTEIKLTEQLEAPVEQGAEVGAMIYKLDNQVIGETKLLAAAMVNRETTESRGFFERIYDWLFY